MTLPLSTRVILVLGTPGSGKSFLAEVLIREMGLLGTGGLLGLEDLTDQRLKEHQGRVLLIDGINSRAGPRRLSAHLDALFRYLTRSDAVAILLGDATLRSSILQTRLHLPASVVKLEPITREFVEGVIRQRFAFFAPGARPHDVIDAHLYRLLVPHTTRDAANLRAILRFLRELASRLPRNEDPCLITEAMARKLAAEALDGAPMSAVQRSFLTILCSSLQERLQGKGLGDGLTDRDLLALGRNVGYRCWDVLYDEVIVPFHRTGLLFARGVPRLDDRDGFLWCVGPYYPSFHLMLMASV